MSEEWQRMLAAVKEEEEAGTPDMLPETPPVSSLEERDQLPDDAGREMPPPSNSPARVVSAAQQGSEITTSGECGTQMSDSDSLDLAGMLLG